MQIKLNYSPKIYEVYSVLDPAIDHTNSNIEKYMETREPEYIKFKEGSTPTRIFMKNIRQSVYQNHMIDKPAITYFAFAIEKIVNPKPFMFSEEVDIIEDGLNIWEPEDVINDGINSIKYCKNAGEIFCMPFLTEMGFVVLGKQNCLRGTKPIYQKLPSLITLSQTINTLTPQDVG